MPRMLVFVVIALSLLVGCVAPPNDSREARLTDLEAKGLRIFSREPCFSACHVNSVASDEAADPTGFVPDLRRSPRRTSDWYLAYFVNPRAVLPYSPMPSFGYLARDDMTALIAYLQRLNRGVPLPRPEPVAAQDIPQTSRDFTAYRAGRIIYKIYCAGCHGDSGNGGGSAGHLLSPEPRNFTDAVWMSKQAENYLFSVITNGMPNTAMPGFSEILTPSQRALVLRYIEYFADPVAKERMELGFVSP